MRLLLFALLINSTILYSQSKSETINWIHEKYGSEASVVVDYFNDFGDFEYRKISIKENGWFEVVSEGTWAKVPSKTILSGNMNKLDPSSVRAKKFYSGVYGVMADCTTDKCIYQNSYLNGKPELPVKIQTCTFVICKDEYEAEKAVKAFKHLIILFGGEEDLF